MVQEYILCAIGNKIIDMDNLGLRGAINPTDELVILLHRPIWCLERGYR